MKNAVLFSSLFLFSFSVSAAQVSDYPLREIVYDVSSPELSVAVMGEELLSMGDLYEGTRVIGFEADAVVLHHLETDSAVKCLVTFGPSPALHKTAVQYFIYKQMYAIHAAQRAYWDKFGGTYAEDLETLVRQGFLKGFENGRKQGYFFEIAETGSTKGFTLLPREATFLAVAAPENSAESDIFFTVNRLGEIRSGATKIEANWGPVWEYSEHLPGPKQEIVRKI